MIHSGRAKAVALQYESTIGAATPHEIISDSGRVQFEFSPKFVSNPTRTKLNRIVSSAKPFNGWYELALSTTLHCDRFQLALLRSLFSVHSYVQHPKLNDEYHVFKSTFNQAPLSRKLWIQDSEGNVFLFHGVIVTGMQIETASRAITRVTWTMAALWLESGLSLPRLSPGNEIKPAQGMFSRIYFDESSLENLSGKQIAGVQKFTVQAKRDFSVAKFGRDGIGRNYSVGTMQVTGSASGILDSSMLSWLQTPARQGPTILRMGWNSTHFMECIFPIGSLTLKSRSMHDTGVSLPFSMTITSSEILTADADAVFRVIAENSSGYDAGVEGETENFIGIDGGNASDAGIYPQAAYMDAGQET